MHSILKDFTGFLAYRIVNYMAANHPEYIEVHTKFDVPHVEENIQRLFEAALLFLIVLGIFIVVKAISQINYYRKNAQYHKMGFFEYIQFEKKEGYVTKPLFTKKSGLIFAVWMVVILVSPIVSLLWSYYPQQFPNGADINDLAYNPGNQPVTDEIVQAMNENVIPEVINSGKIALDVVSNPELAAEVIEEVTGVNAEEILQEIDN